MENSATRDSLNLFVNGTPYRVTGEDAFLTLSQFLRQREGLIGTKIVCSEGDCGACSVLVGRPTGGSTELTYRPIDSCIAFMHQLDRVHVVSVEGVSCKVRDQANSSDHRAKGSDELSAVQNAMVRCHGSQCGYCTPGFVMALHGMYEEHFTSNTHEPPQTIDETSMRTGLSGNLCRCTGYVQIIDAGLSVSSDQVTLMNSQYPAEQILEHFEQLGDSPIEISTADRRVLIPQTLDQALEFRSRHPEAMVVAGATDLGVQHNHGRHPSQVVICLSQVAELSSFIDDDASLVIGAAVSWSHLMDRIGETFPQLVDILLRFGSPQIRNIGTIGGNIINASPIGDSLPFLFVAEAVVTLASTRGRREVPINDFYHGYKQIDLAEDELLESIRVPHLQPNESLKLYKISKRRDMDISTFSAGMLLAFDGETITSARVAVGGVGPVVLRTRQAEDYLTGKRFSESAMKEAGDIAAGEISPITDVRGSLNYRTQLTRNIFVKCFHDLSQETSIVAP